MEDRLYNLLRESVRIEDEIVDVKYDMEVLEKDRDDDLIELKDKLFKIRREIKSCS